MSTPASDRPPAVAAASTAESAWEATVRHQLRAAAAHSDFYALAGDIVLGLISVQSLARVLRRQVIGYQQLSGVYDDSRSEPDAIDPLVRLALAAEALGDFDNSLAAAIGYANEFWSAIGHIGVDLPADEDGELR